MQHDHARGPRPLTHPAANGRPYERLAAVESQLCAALALPPQQRVAHARTPEKNASEYLQEEALVYLIREAQQEGNELLVEELSECLLHRCAGFIDGKIRGLGQDAYEDAYSAIVARLFAWILDLNSDQGDFLQVRFWVALDKLASTIFSTQAKALAATRARLSLDTSPDDEQDSGLTRYVPSKGLSVEDYVLCWNAVSAITNPHHRMAFVLRYYYRWPIENDDPAGPSISGHVGKDPRTVRNWLAGARADLARWHSETSALVQGGATNE